MTSVHHVSDDCPRTTNSSITLHESGHIQAFEPLDLITVARVLFTHHQHFEQHLTPISGSDLQLPTSFRFTRYQQHGHWRTQYCVHSKRRSAEFGRVVVVLYSFTRWRAVLYATSQTSPPCFFFFLCFGPYRCTPSGLQEFEFPLQKQFQIQTNCWLPIFALIVHVFSLHGSVTFVVRMP